MRLPIQAYPVMRNFSTEVSSLRIMKFVLESTEPYGVCFSRGNCGGHPIHKNCHRHNCKNMGGNSWKPHGGRCVKHI